MPSAMDVAFLMMAGAMAGTTVGAPISPVDSRARGFGEPCFHVFMPPDLMNSAFFSVGPTSRTIFFYPSCATFLPTRCNVPAAALDKALRACSSTQVACTP
jgi:hypothetical protein